MAIYITGDTHADFKRLGIQSFPEQREMTKDDYVIICGDFGGVWSKEEDKNERYWLDWLENRPFTTLFVDGNHENFDRLYSMPVEEWHGGLVHEIRPSVLHLMRGEIYDIDGCSFFTFGGARSHDIGSFIDEADGKVNYTQLLDRNDSDYKTKKKEFDRDWLAYRIRGLTWWDEEMPSQAEMDYGLENLKRYGNSVDYIITHDCHTEGLRGMYGSSICPDKLNDYFEQIRNTVDYKTWIFGHHHTNLQVANKDFCLYEQIVGPVDTSHEHDISEETCIDDGFDLGDDD